MPIPLKILAPPIRKQPFAPWPHFESDEIEAVTQVLASGKVNYWTGEEGRHFEQAFARFADADYAIALYNGTIALEAALYALGIGAGDEVIVPARTYVATAHAVVLQGATPVFADVDPDSQNITADTIAAGLTPRTQAVIVVHLAGQPCDMDPILALARQHNLKVIEDCAQAVGATYKGRPVGTFGDVGAWSFCQDKILTTGGEGGMITTNDRTLWEEIWAYKDHGKSYDAVYHQKHGPGFRWLVESFGTNGRMTEMQAVIGQVSLKKVPVWLETRRHHAEILRARFAEISGLRTPSVPADSAGFRRTEHVYYKFYTFVRSERLKAGWSRDRIILEIKALGIPCFSGICGEIYLEKAFEKAGLQPPARLPIAQQLGETSLMFMVHPTLTEQDMHDTADALAYVMEQAT